MGMNDDRKKYLNNEVKPILVDLTHKLGTERPENTVEFIIENLIQYFNYSNEPLSQEEKEELKDLRIQVKDKRTQENEKNPFLNLNSSDVKKTYNRQITKITFTNKPV